MRPLARRRDSTARPLLVFIRERNPCVFERRRRLGWNVRFGMRKLRSSLAQDRVKQTKSITVRAAGWQPERGNRPQRHRFSHRLRRRSTVTDVLHAAVPRASKVTCVAFVPLRAKWRSKRLLVQVSAPCTKHAASVLRDEKIFSSVTFPKSITRVRIERRAR